MSDLLDARDYYARRAHVYDLESSKRRDTSWPQRPFIAKLLHRALTHAGGGILADVGIGTGRLEEAFSLPGSLRVVGVDSSLPMARRASQRLAVLGRRDLVVVGDAHALPFQTQSVDVIVSISVIQYLRLSEALSEFRRCIKSSGYLLTGVVLRHDDDRDNWRRYAFSDEHALLRQYFSRSEVRDSISSAGFATVSEERVRFRRAFSDIARDRSMVNSNFELSGLVKAVDSAPMAIRRMYDIDAEGFTQHYGVFLSRPR